MFEQKRLSGTAGKTVLALVAALVIGLCFNEETLARGGHGGGGHGGHGGHHGGHGGHAGRAASRSHGGNRTSRSRSHNRNHRWARSSFNAGYGCNVYYDAAEATSYYWCPPDNCYYPVSYCPYGRYTFE